MPRRAVSVTLDEGNLTWLRGRARVEAEGNLSELLDRLVTKARTGTDAPQSIRSVVGTVQIPIDDPDLSRARAAVRALFEASLSRPIHIREAAEPLKGKPRAGRSTPRRRDRA